MTDRLIQDAKNKLIIRLYDEIQRLRRALDLPPDNNLETLNFERTYDNDGRGYLDLVSRDQTLRLPDEEPDTDDKILRLDVSDSGQESDIANETPANDPRPYSRNPRKKPTCARCRRPCE